MEAIVSFLISALMGMGIGGGGLFVIYLTLCLKLPQVVAQGTNLLFFVIAGLSSLFYHLKKRKIVLWQVVIMILFGSVGSIVFSHFANIIDPKYPRVALGILLAVSGSLSLYSAIIKPLVKKFKKTLYK